MSWLSKLKFRYVFFIALALSFLLFGNTISGEPVMDDYSVIADRTILRDLSKVPQILFLPWHHGHSGLELGLGYRPLTLASYAIDFSISSDSTASFHVINILLYALNAVLVFYLAKKIFSPRAAAISSILFLFLPIHVESVAAIVGRADLLAAGFSLGSLLLFFNKRYILSSAVFLLALLSKEFAVILLPLIAVLLFIDRGIPEWRQSIKNWLYYLPPIVIYFLIFRYFALGEYAFKGGFLINQVINPLAYVSIKERIFTSFLHIFLYLKKTIYPVDLSPDYSFNQIPAIQNLFASPGALIGLLFLIAVTLFFIFGNRVVKIVTVLFLGPVFLITNIAWLATGAMAERFWYFPSVGLAMLVAIGVDKIWQYKNFKFIVLGLSAPILIWYSFLIIKQNKVWLNERALFTHAVEKSPNSVWARTSLAASYLSSGEVEKARNELEAGLKIYDKDPRILMHWGRLRWKDGNLEEAEKIFKKAIDLDTIKIASRGLYKLLAFLYLEKGENKKALAAIEKANSFPIVFDDVQYYQNLDQEIYEGIKNLQGRTLDSYSEAEKEGLRGHIQSVRGF